MSFSLRFSFRVRIIGRTYLGRGLKKFHSPRSRPEAFNFFKAMKPALKWQELDQDLSSLE